MLGTPGLGPGVSGESAPSLRHPLLAVPNRPPAELGFEGTQDAPPPGLLAPFLASSVALGLGKGLGYAWYLGRGRRGRGASSTAGSRVTPACRGARIAKLLGELKPEEGDVVIPQSGLKVYCFAWKNIAMSISMFLWGWGVSQVGLGIEGS